jgi:TrmH family RNA methyltransferase
VTSVSDRVMQRISDAATAPGVVAVVRTPDLTLPVPASGPLLVLDRVADPGNVGTLLRTAAAFGATVVSLGGADPFGPKAVRASAGACYRTTVHRPEDDADLGALLRGAGRVVLGLAADGSRSIAEVAHVIPATGVVLVVGSEPHGLSADLTSLLDERVRIPMAPGVESLNVAAAGAIAMQAFMPV